MKYMGSKARFVNQMLPIILNGRKIGQYYVEPFAGGMNMICEVKGNRIANDIHPYLIPMWKAFVYDDFNPDFIEKEVYKLIQTNPNNYPTHLVGWVGFGCSYSGKWMAGYAGLYPNLKRNYQTETLNSIKRQIPKLKGVQFYNLPYNQVAIPENSIIYCDPPYENTSKYKTGQEFNHSEFWEWCRMKRLEGHTVYISEYNAPDDFVCVWSKEVTSQLSANGKSGGTKFSIEKLFVHKDDFKPTNDFF